MISRKRLQSFVGLFLLGFAALGPSPASAAKDTFVWYNGKLVGVTTDAQGTVLTIGIQENSGAIQTGNGCGAKIVNLPHFVERIGKSAQVRVKDGCVDRYHADGHFK